MITSDLYIISRVIIIIKNVYTCTGRLFQNVPILCGGFAGVARYSCQGLKNGKWANLTEMNEPREFGSATVISADDKEYLLITGNYFTM